MTESEEKKSTRSRGINARQSQILDFIRQYIFNNGYPPSVREIGSAVGLSSSASVHNNLKKLAEAGFVSWDPEKAPHLRAPGRNQLEEKEHGPRAAGGCRSCR